GMVQLFLIANNSISLISNFLAELLHPYTLVKPTNVIFNKSTVIYFHHNIYFIEDVVFIFSWFLIFNYSDKIIDVRIVYFIVFTNRQCITHTPFFHKSKFFATNIKKNIIMEILFSILLHHLIALPFYIYPTGCRI